MLFSFEKLFFGRNNFEQFKWVVKFVNYYLATYRLKI